MSDQVKLNTLPLGLGAGVSGLGEVADGTPGQYLKFVGPELKPVWDTPPGSVTVQNSIEFDGPNLQLVGDAASPGANQIYGTDGSGNKGWNPIPGSGGVPTIAPGDKKKAIQVKYDESGYELVSANKLAANYVSLLSILTDVEAIDVLSGANTIDISAKIAAAITDLATNSPGFTFDMSMLHGSNMTLTQDWFNGLATAKGTIITGPIKILVNFNLMNFRIPSYMTWEAHNTLIESSTPITGVANREGGIGYLVNTFVGGNGRTADGVFTDNLLQVSNADDIQIGATIAVYGTQRDFIFSGITLGANITSSTASFPLSGASTIDPAMVMIRIGGTEYAYGLYSGGTFDTSVPGGGRGMLGSTAASHSSGDAILIMQSAVRTVVGISGTTLTMDANNDITFSGAEFRFGTVKSSITGDLQIDGKDNKAVPVVASWNCLGALLSADFTASGLRLIGGITGGYMLMGARRAYLNIRTIDLCGRPASTLGASGWLFGSNKDIFITVEQTSNGNISNAVDNKSSGLFSMGLWQPNYNFYITHKTVLSHIAAHDITASSFGYCLTNYADCTTSLAGIFDGTPQAPAPILCTNVTIEVKGYKTFLAPVGNSISGTLNFIRIGNYYCGPSSGANLTMDGVTDDTRVTFNTNNVTKWRIQSAANALNIYNGAFSAGVYLANQSATSWTAVSDRRVKKDIKTLSVLDRIEGFNAVSYTNKLTGAQEIGVIAQDEFSRRPEFVHEGSGSDDDVIKSMSDPRKWAVIYDRYGVEALQGVKELLSLVRVLQADIEKLKGDKS